MSMRTIFEAQYTPIVSDIGDWWDEHVIYSKFSRQGIDIVCASFQHEATPSPRASVIVVPGWSDTLLNYAEVVKYLYGCEFNIHLYDHQSQGLSGRWLHEQQSIWINTFEDYVDDFVYFATSVSREQPSLPLYVIGYCMGGLIVSIAMSRMPSLVNRAVLLSPMFRNKCAIKWFNYKISMPQPLARWLAMCACWAGLGAMHSMGFFKEAPNNSTFLNVTTSDEEQALILQSLRQRFPETMATCVTNDWVYQTIRAQRKFAHRYEFVRTSTLIVCAEHDYFVYNRAMQEFLKKARSSRLFFCEGAYHDILHEEEYIRGAIRKAIADFFQQSSDNVYALEPPSPLLAHGRDMTLIRYSFSESFFRAVGFALAGVGILTGVALIIMPGRRR